MLVENQLVETTWSTSNKKWYVEKGYQFANIRDKLLVKVEDLMPSSCVKVNVKCDYCGRIYQAKYHDYNRSIKIIKKTCCSNSECKAKKIHDSKIERYKYDQYSNFLELCNKRGYKPISTINDYQGSTVYLEYECPYHGIKKTTIDNLKHHGCNECGNIIISQKFKKTEKDLIDEVEIKNGCKILNPNEYIDIKTKNLKIICGICGDMFTTSLAIFKNGTGKCLNCAKEDMVKNRRISKDKVKQIIESKNNNQILNLKEYTSVFRNNLMIKCGTCGEVYNISLANYRKNWFSGKCKKCHDISLGEKNIAKFLDEAGVVFTRQEHFNGDLHDIKPIPLDFYLPDYRTAIEFDGQGHYYPIWGEESFYRTILHDGMKNNYCKWNDIKLIRIPYWKGSIFKEILSKELNLPCSKSKKIKYIPNRKTA